MDHRLLLLAEALILVIYSRSINGEFLFDDAAILDMDFARRHYVLLGCLKWDDPRNRTSPPVPLWQIAFEDLKEHPKAGGGYYWLHQWHKQRDLYQAFRSFIEEPRSLTHLSYYWTWRTANEQFTPWVWHAVNMGLHQMNTLLVYLLVSLIRPAAAGPAALLFAVHPHQVAAVSYVSGRSSLLATFFGLLDILVCAQTGVSWVWLASVSAFCVIFAAKSKEDGLLWIGLFMVSFVVLRTYFG